MKIKIHDSIKSDEGLLVVPIFKENLKKLPTIFPKAIKDFVTSLVKNKEFDGKRGEHVETYFEKKGLPNKVLIIGLGEMEKYKNRYSRRIGGTIGKHAKAKKSEEITILFVPELSKHGQEFLEGILMSQYQVGILKTADKVKNPEYELKKLDVISADKSREFKRSFDRAEIINASSEMVKDLVNLPSNLVDAEYMANEAKRIAKDNRYKIAIYGEKELIKMNWGGLLAVNQGASKEAKCVVLEYDGAKSKREKPIVIVGKGVIFDTGGYNLKPTSSIETMHQDMAGGATVLGVFDLLRRLDIRKNVIGIIPLAENLISAKAYRPSDIITMLSGKTVEITNTDAEGRLILADALFYGTRFKPQAIISIATLTGAVAVALGNRYAGLVSNDQDLRQKIQKAGMKVDERGWPLPLINDYRKKMDSKVADIRNYDMGSGRYAGASKAAGFLERFIEENKWCHIDIGGTAFTDDPKEYQTNGATAHGLQTLIQFLEDEAKA